MTELSIGKTITMLIDGAEVTVKGNKQNKTFVFRFDFTSAHINYQDVPLDLINELFHHNIITIDSGNLERMEKHLKWNVNATKLTM
jgi:hypothetical protein